MNEKIFRFMLDALAARRRLFFTVLAATMLSALLLSLLLPKTYVATATVLAHGKREQLLTPGTPLFDRERAGYLQTQAEILTSARVARQVVKALNLEEDREMQAAFRALGGGGDFDDWAGEQMLRRIKVTSSQGSVLQISASADDPQQAARIANAFAQTYLDNALALHVEPLKMASQWFDQQLASLSKDVNGARQRLVDFQREEGLLASDEQHEADGQRLTELTLLSARTLAVPPPAAGGEPRTIGDLNSALSLAQAKLAELSSEYGPRHPRVLRQQAETAALQEQLNANVTAGLEDTQRRRSAEQRQRQQLQTELSRQRERVGQLREAHTRVALLRSDYANAQRAYDLAVQRAIATRIDSHAALPDVSLLSEALPPNAATKPRTTLNLAIAGLLGILLGLLSVYLAESADRRIRSLNDLVLDPQLPLLAVLDAVDGPMASRPRLTGPNRPQALPGTL